MIQFESFKDRISLYRFRLKAANGDVLLASEGFTVKDRMQLGIAIVKDLATNDAHFRRTHADKGYTFSLVATNGQVIGTSKHYPTEAEREQGIATVKQAAPGAAVREV